MWIVRTRPFQYLLALIAVVTATLVQSAFPEVLGERAPFILYYPAVIVSVMIGGFGPGLAATLLSAALCDYVLLSPGGFSAFVPINGVRLATFLLSGLTICALGHVVHRTRIRIETSSRALLETEARGAAVLESALDAIIFIDDIGRVLEWNPAAERIFGYRASETVGKDLAVLIIPERHRPDHYAGLKRYKETGTGPVLNRRVELPGLRRNGEEFEAELTISAIRGGGDRHIFVGTLRDISVRKIEQRALERSESRYRSLVDAITSIVWTIDPEGRFVTPQESWGRYTGQTWEEYRDFGWVNALHPDDRERVGASWAAARTSATPYNSEGRIWHGATRSWRYFVARAVPIRDADGLVREWVGNCVDVHEARTADELLRQSEQRFRMMADSAAVLVWINDASKRPTWFNRSWLDFVRRNLDEELQRGWFESVHPDDLARCRSAYDMAFDARRPITQEYRLQRFDGTYRWMLDSGVPLQTSDGTFLGYIGTCVDITARKEIEHEQEHRLEAEKAAREEFERASQLKDEFLSTLSHELRTPLNAILGWSQLLRTIKPEDSDHKIGIETIERNARVQAQLIDDLLDMSRIISGKLRLDVQRLQVAPVAEAAIDALRPAAEAKQIRLQAVLDPHAGVISGDPSRLQQVIWNLLSNAIKFTPRGGRVQVLLERIDSNIELSVIDTGEGIEPEFLPHLFERFRQADASSTRQHGGLGLGLSIVKSLVELHGGTVSATSGGPGQGATFVVKLPLTVVHPPEQKATDRVHPLRGHVAPAPDNGPSLADLRVLVVDDEADARDLIRRVLERCGALVTTVASGDEALQSLQREVPDVLISDIGMPVEDGYSLIRRVRALPIDAGGRVPAAALTAFARSEDRRRSLISGFNMHIPKPVEPAELIAAVASLAARHRYQPD